MSFLYPSYMRMSAKALRRHLIKRKTPDVLREQIEEVCAQQREQRRVQRITQTLRAQAWGELLAPLREELRTARASQRYHLSAPPTPETLQCRAAFSTYITQMEKLMKNLTRMQNKEGDDYASPLTLARKAQLPNDGEHWSDWVKPESRVQVEELFASIPYRFKAKRKAPYPREMPLTARRRKAEKLLAKARAQQEAIERELHIRVADAERAERLGQMQELRDSLDVVKRDIVKLNLELRRIEDADRSKKQRDTKKQAAVQDAPRGDEHVRTDDDEGADNTDG